MIYVIIAYSYSYTLVCSVCRQEQYEFCYELVLTYLKEFDTYSNFR